MAGDDHENFPSLEVQIPENDPGVMRKLIIVASIAAGIQFGWALQLSLLTPYVQLLGIPHTWSSFIWLCGPVSGMIVQPLVGYFSDASTSKYGRRRPFIASGALLVIIAVVLIGFAADFGHMAGDSLTDTVKSRAVALFVIGFWILDVANNMLQGPCRAFLADLCNGDPNKAKAANALFSFFMAVGNILGYSAGAYTKLYQIFPFSKTAACDVYCANLKSCFILDIILLFIVSIAALTTVGEKPQSMDETSEGSGKGGGKALAFFAELFGAFKNLPRPMWILLLVTALNWIAWFPFLLYDTDWMGKEVYGGEVGKGEAYDIGVRAGALGLMINSVVLGFSSLGVDFLSRGANGVKRLWGVVNFILAIGMAMTVWVTKVAEQTRQYGADGNPLPPSDGVKAGALSIFGVLGIPLAVTYSIPFALASMYSMSSGAGQGLSLGVLNLAIVTPQMFVSVVSGPWDSLLGGGNLPAFVAGGVAAAISGLLAFFVLPTPPSNVNKVVTIGGGGH